jgi:hypothetical protein
MTHNPDPDSPFAEFAQPKPSALDVIRERQRQEAEQFRRRVLTAVCAGFGAALAGGIGGGLGESWQLLLEVVGFAFVGTLAGLLLSWIFAAGAWTAVRLGRTSMLLPNNPAALTAWLTVCGLFGIAFGASAGAELGRSFLTGEPLTSGAWSLPAAAVGLAVGLLFAVWLIRRRKTESA